jgi:hypothetical protein
MINKEKSYLIQKDVIKQNDVLTEKVLTNIDKEFPTSSGFWAYHAGLADGDGCFQILRNKSKNVRYKLKLNDLAPVKALADVYGASISKVVHSNKKWNDNYITRINGDRAYHFFKKVCPYLTEKRKQVTKLINLKFKNYHPKKIPMNKANLGIHVAYMAGFFDAEGSVKCDLKTMKRLGKKGKPIKFIRVLCKMTNTDLTALKKIQTFITSYPFTYNKKQMPIYSTLPKKNAKAKKMRYDLHISDGKELLFMALMEPAIMIPRKLEVIRKLKVLYAVDKMVGKRLATNYPINLKKELGLNQKIR